MCLGLNFNNERELGQFCAAKRTARICPVQLGGMATWITREQLGASPESAPIATHHAMRAVRYEKADYRLGDRRWNKPQRADPLPGSSGLPERGGMIYVNRLNALGRLMSWPNALSVQSFRRCGS